MGMLLDELLEKPEGKTLEFKRDLSSAKPILKTIVAFANTAGGSLILGVDDDRKIVGVDDPLTLEEKLTSLISDNIMPSLLPTIKIVSHKNKNLLWIEIPYMAAMGPFYLKQEGLEKGVMVRLGSSSRVATPEMIQELKRVRHAQSFDMLPCVQTTYNDLNHALIKKTFKQARQVLTKAKLKSLKLLVPYGDDYVPSNAAIILFGKLAVREQFFPMAYVSCARFAGTEKVDFLDRLDIESIIEAVDAVPAFIRRNTRMGAVIKEIRRKDIPEYPSIGIREGLLNALMHADYSHINMRTFVSIFDDRLEIRNPGCLPPGMTIEGIKEGISIPRNLVIARVFQMLGWVEQFGTGYLRITKSCAQHDYSLPQWREIGPYTDIIFRSLPMESIHDLSPRGQDGDKMGTSHISADELSKVLEFCQAPRSVAEIMTLLNRSSRDKFLGAILRPALDKKLLEMTIPEKPNSRLQRYKITQVGLLQLKKS